MLNFRKYGLKIFACAMLVIMALVCAPNLGSFSFVNAYVSEGTSVSNGTFVSTSSNDFPKTPSNWSVVTGSYENTSMKAGVISTNVDDFLAHSDEYGLTVNPHTRLSNDDESILMINSEDKTVRYGYKSENISLEANSFYVFTIDMRTYETSVGSIYLNIDDSVKSSFVAKTTNSNWGIFKFYVETNELTSSKASIEVWLGGKEEVLSNGVVFFDNVTSSRYTETDFYYEKENIVYDDSSSKFLSLKGTSEITSTKIVNANFEEDEITWQAIKNTNTDEEDENTIKNYTKSGVTVIGKDYVSSETGILDNPLTNNSKDNTKALFINNSQPAGYGYKSNKFTIERFAFYKLGVYVKTSSMEEGGASIRLVPTDSELSKYEFTNVVAADNAKNSITNNWSLYTFYIAGSCFTDIEVELQLWLGNEDSKAKGYVFFDDVEMYQIDYATYSNATDSNNVKLATYIESNNSTNIKNAFFNIVNVSNTTLPYAPADWEKENTTTENVSGIIVANKAHFNANKANYGYITFEDIGYTRLQSDKSDSATNNLLMIYNENAGYQSYTSSSYTLTGGEDSYYKVSVDVRTLLSSGNAYIDFAASDDGLFASYDVVSNNEWTTVTAYIHVGAYSQDVTIKLGLGKVSKTVAGYAMFDNVIVEKSDKDAYLAAKESEDSFVKTVDVEKDGLFISNGEKNTLIGSDYVTIKTPANLTFEASANSDVCDYGIIDVEGNDTIYINNAIDGKYKLTSKLVNNLASGVYYEIAYTIKTENLAQDEANKKTKTEDDEEKVIPFGAEFGITENTTTFAGVDTKGEKQTFYIYLEGGKVTAATPFVSLGYTDAYTSGSLYVYSILIKEVTAEDYKEIADTYFSEDEEVVKDPSIIVLSEVAEEVEEEEEKEEDTTVTDTFDWLIVPSLITGVAILIALIGVLLKNSKLSKKSGKVKGKSSYDRKKTLHPQVARRQAEEAREAKLAEIAEKMRIVNEEIQRQEEEYALKREAQKKEKQARKAEKEFKAYARKRAKLEKDKEKLEQEKEEANSEEFLQKTEEKIIADYEKSATTEEVTEDVTSETEVEVIDSEKGEDNAITDEEVVEVKENTDQDNDENKK